MDRRLALLPPVVLLSSLLGLSKPMADLDGWDTFAGVWGASLWGDLLFTAGTMAAAWATWWLVRAFWTMPDARRWLWVLAAPLAALAHWMVYAFAWAFTWSNWSGDAGFFAMGAAWDGNFGFVWEQGWLGLVAVPIVAAVAAWMLETRPWESAAPAAEADA